MHRLTLTALALLWVLIMGVVASLQSHGVVGILIIAGVAVLLGIRVFRDISTPLFVLLAHSASAAVSASILVWGCARCEFELAWPGFVLHALAALVYGRARSTTDPLRGVEFLSWSLVGGGFGAALFAILFDHPCGPCWITHVLMAIAATRLAREGLQPSQRQPYRLSALGITALASSLAVALAIGVIPGAARNPDERFILATLRDLAAKGGRVVDSLPESGSKNTALSFIVGTGNPNHAQLFLTPGNHECCEQIDQQIQLLQDAVTAGQVQLELIVIPGTGLTAKAREEAYYAAMVSEPLKWPGHVQNLVNEGPLTSGVTQEDWALAHSGEIGETRTRAVTMALELGVVMTPGWVITPPNGKRQILLGKKDRDSLLPLFAPAPAAALTH